MVVYDARLATRLTSPVNRRLRMFALVKGQALNHALVELLDQVLPPADELAAALSGPLPEQAPETTAGPALTTPGPLRMHSPTRQ